MTATRYESARLAAHYFRTEPTLAWRALVVHPVKGATLCRLRGHRHGGNVHRLLGLCGRCWTPLDAHP